MTRFLQKACNRDQRPLPKGVFLFFLGTKETPIPPKTSYSCMTKLNMHAQEEQWSLDAALNHEVYD